MLQCRQLHVHEGAPEKLSAPQLQQTAPAFSNLPCPPLLPLLPTPHSFRCLYFLLISTSTGILEVVNSLLSGGEVPGLWSFDELAKEVAPLEAAREADVAWQGPPGAAGLYSYFLQRIKVYFGAI